MPEGSGHVGDVVYHPVVFDGFPNVRRFGFRLEVTGELSEGHVIDGDGPLVDGRLSEGDDGFGRFLRGKYGPSDQ